MGRQLAVVVGEVAVGPGGSGGDELGVVGVDVQGAAVDGGGAARAERAAPAAGSEGGAAVGGDGDGVAGGAGGGAGGVVDDEVVAGELVGTELGVAAQRDRFDRRRCGRPASSAARTSPEP